MKKIDIKNGDKCPFEISVQGDPIIDCCYINQIDKTVAAISVQIKQKYCEISAAGSDENIPLLIIDIPQNGELKTNLTEIMFEYFRGWSVWSANISKYTAHVCLIKDIEI